jgi:hypothetical protein
VYRALDRKRNAVVALKTLSRGDSDALYRFKQEFRSLADIAHPNLVSLYELLSENGQWFFTMELVEGVEFLDYVQGGRTLGSGESGASTPSPAPVAPAPAEPDAQGLMRIDLSAGITADPAKLWPALAQLAEGLHALHCAGKLHRDIKPSNVLVTREGRVVLLDFGLVSELSKEGILQSLHVVGTPAYMSPEQAAGGPMTAASDWYGVGVMLYQALTGTLPFPGPLLDVLVRKQNSEPPPPRDLCPAISSELDQFCRSLLRRDPGARPSGDEILAFLRAATRPSAEAPAGELARARTFVGRRKDLEALHAAFDRAQQGCAVVLIEGLAGMGKTALVRRFLEELRQREPRLVVLSGRCFDQETVPYKALDSLVDALSNHLKRLRASEVEALLPRDTLPLSRVFPVLRQVEAIAATRRRVLAIPDSQELRRRAFGGLRELLARLADRAPLVLFIDDLQWGDADSAALLAEILRPPDPPGVLLLSCCRSEDAGKSPLVAALRSLRSSMALDLSERQIAELAPDEALELARALLAGSPHAADAAESVARESRGNPLFIGELTQHACAGAPGANQGLPMSGTVRLEDVIWERIVRLSDDARRLLCTVAVAGQPLDRTIARRAAELAENDQPAITLLRAGHLVRGLGAEGEDQIEIYNDLIRGTILRRLTASEKEATHERLALALETAMTPDAERLAVHYEAAGAKERAAKYAADAAEKAAEALAFDRAARLYRQALELGTTDTEGRQRLRVLLGDALANAGRGAEAARAYLSAADEASATENLVLSRRAAEQLLRSGHVDEGLDVLRRVLDRIGLKLPGSARRAMLSFLWRRIQLRLRGLGFDERGASEISADALIRIDACWAVSAGLSLIDTIRGRDFQTRHLLLALRAGEPYRIARAMGPEAAYTAYLGGWSARRRTAALSERAIALSERVAHPHAIGMSYLCAGLAAYLEGRFEAGWDLAEKCESVLREQCTGVAWELDMVHVYSLRALFLLGRLKDLRSRVSTFLKEAVERGDLFAAVNLQTRLTYIPRLMSDEPGRAAEELERAAATWSRSSFYMQHYFHLIADAEISLYEGSSVAAFDRLIDRWGGLQQSLVRRAPLFRVESEHTRARCALAAALNPWLTPARRRKFLRVAARDARRIARDPMPCSLALSELLRAGLAAARGQKSDALERLHAAQSGFEASRMSLYAAAARRCGGLLLGNEEGARLVAEADAWMTREGIRNPERMTAMLAPGPWSTA